MGGAQARVGRGAALGKHPKGSETGRACSRASQWLPAVLNHRRHPTQPPYPPMPPCRPAAHMLRLACMQGMSQLPLAAQRGERGAEGRATTLAGDGEGCRGYGDGRFTGGAPSLTPTLAHPSLTPRRAAYAPSHPCQSRSR